MSAVVLSRGQTFMVLDSAGEALVGEQGLYAGDRRLCSRYAWRTGRRRSLLLSGRALSSGEAQFFLAVPAFAHDGRAELVLERRLGLLDGGFTDHVRLRNYGQRGHTIWLHLDLACDFAHVFHVKRNALGDAARSGCPSAPREDLGDGRFAYSGRASAQGIVVRLEFSRPPDGAGEDGHLAFRVAVPARGAAEFSLRCALAPRVEAQPAQPAPRGEPSRPRLEASGALGPAFTQAFLRSLQDLEALSIRGGAIGMPSTDQSVAYAAGIPWYIALFGRDALLTSRMTVYCLPRQGEGSLRALAALQGRRSDPSTEEEPGKILHEYRPTPAPEAAALIPRFPYYGSVDATPLYLIALEEHVRCAGRPELAQELSDTVRAALRCIDAGTDRHGYLRYQRHGGEGLVNQGWKDSWDAVHFPDGRLAEGPIALCEVQGYLYRARIAAARLLESYGDAAGALEQRRRASALRRSFDRDFWLGRGCYALGLDGLDRPIGVLTSNSLHVLWTGIARQSRAQRLAREMLASPLWSGRGVRTLAAGEGRYDPVSYHNGSIWPHDNALIAEGLRHTGHPRPALAIVEALLRIARGRPERRLPELYSGFGTDESSEPVRYPAACPVQAWSAASVPHALSVMLGIVVAAGEVRLRPCLPSGLDSIDVEGLLVAGGRLDVHLARDRQGRLHCEADGDVPLPVRIVRGVRCAGEDDVE